MKELLMQYGNYNAWANKLMTDTLLVQPTQAIDMKMISSFDSLGATVLHCWGAEDIWLQRLLLAKNPEWKPSTFNGSFEEACISWKQASRGLCTYIAGCDDTALQAVVAFKDRKGNGYSMPACQMLHHVFNHGTYHRGQLVTMLRQAGATEIPGTDFITYARLS